MPKIVNHHPITGYFLKINGNASEIKEPNHNWPAIRQHFRVIEKEMQ